VLAVISEFFKAVFVPLERPRDQAKGLFCGSAERIPGVLLIVRMA
jgi:hypothetical protein